jgi:hypothetical protein
MISVEVAAHLYFGVKCDAVKCRQIAASLMDLADIIDGDHT